MARNKTFDQLKAENESAEERTARETVEVIAATIESLSRQVKSLLGGRVKKQTIVILLSQTTKLPQYQIEAVLNALSDMERQFLNK